jgi:pimeloyl-ACP methyl ester carboxylesterase
MNSKQTILSLLISAVALLSFSACSEDDEKPKTTSTYVLVHGAWQAPYVWKAVSEDLQKAGNKVITVELPGHGNDNTPTYTLSQDVYRDKVIDAISQVDSKVILVGHSMGGMVVTNVAEKVPSKISKLVYIGAFVPASGQALVNLVDLDPDSQLGQSLIQSADKLTLDVQHDNLINLFINDGTQEVKESMLANYRAEPSIPFTNPVIVTKENFGTVNKVYIKTLQDIVISPSLQDRMIEAAGITTVYPINTSHSPFLAQPHTVSDLLLRIGNE